MAFKMKGWSAFTKTEDSLNVKLIEGSGESVETKHMHDIIKSKAIANIGGDVTDFASKFIKDAEEKEV